MSYPAWINGQEQAALDVLDRGTAYGDGVFETLRFTPQPVLLDFHFQRLALGLQRLGFSVDVQAIRQQVADYQTRHQAAVIKLMVTRGSGGRGYLPPAEPHYKVIINGFDLPGYSQANAKQGIDVYLCRTPLALNPCLAGIKHLNRLEQVLARQEFANLNYPEGLMADLDGYLLEGTASNLFLVEAGKLLSPALNRIAVRGTLQRYLLEQTPNLGIECAETEQITVQRLLNADEVFVCNSLFGIWPVVALAGQPLNVIHRAGGSLNSSNSITRMLQKSLVTLFP